MDPERNPEKKSETAIRNIKNKHTTSWAEVGFAPAKLSFYRQPTRRVGLPLPDPPGETCTQLQEEHEDEGGQ